MRGDSGGFGAPKKRHLSLVETGDTKSVATSSNKVSTDVEPSYSVHVAATSTATKDMIGPPHRGLEGVRNIAEAVDQWLTVTRLAPTTERTYRTRMHGFKAFIHQQYGEAATPADVTTFDCQKWSARLGNITSGSLRTAQAPPRSFFKWAVKTGLVGRSPWEDVDMPRQNSTVNRYVSDGDLEALWFWAGPLDKTIITMGLHFGMRCIEMERLQATDIRDGADGRLIDIRGKGGGGQITRTLSYVGEGQVLLDYWLQGRRLGPVLPSQQRPESALTAAAISQRVTRLSQVAGLHVMAHDFRHTFAETLVRAGVPINDLAKAMGHSSISTTTRYVGGEAVRSAMGGRRYFTQLVAAA